MVKFVMILLSYVFFPRNERLCNSCREQLDYEYHVLFYCKINYVRIEKNYYSVNPLLLKYFL